MSNSYFLKKSVNVDSLKLHDSKDTSNPAWCHFQLNLGLKISYLVSELHELKIFEIRFGGKVHAVNTYYVKWKLF